MTRLLLVLSLFVAFGFRGIVAVAAPTETASHERMPTLGAETITQFELAFRANPNEGQARREQLEAVVSAWRTAPRTDPNNERLTSWLLGAIRASMPGSHDELPEAPTFADATGRGIRQSAKTTSKIVHSAEPTLAVPAATPTKSGGPTDPFQDDPTDKQDTK